MADMQLKQAIDSVTFWRNKVSKTFHKNAKRLRTYNLWAAEDKAQHMAEASRNGDVHDYEGPKVIDFELPIYVGSRTDPETEEE